MVHQPWLQHISYGPSTLASAYKLWSSNCQNGTRSSLLWKPKKQAYTLSSMATGILSDYFLLVSEFWFWGAHQWFFRIGIADALKEVSRIWKDCMVYLAESLLQASLYYCAIHMGPRWKLRHFFFSLFFFCTPISYNKVYNIFDRKETRLS